MSPKRDVEVEATAALFFFFPPFFSFFFLVIVYIKKLTFCVVDVEDFHHWMSPHFDVALG